MRGKVGAGGLNALVWGVLALLCACCVVCGMSAVRECAYAADAAADPFEDAAEVDKDDGLYLVDVSMEGGTGKASVDSPAEFEVFEGRGVVTLVWSSSHYDYMLLNGKKYLPVNTRGNSMFVIPVLAYDEPFEVVGDTTAMGSPHEVGYRLTVSLGSVRAYDSSQVKASSAGSAASASAANSADSANSAISSDADQASASASASQDAATQEGGLPWPWVVFIVCAILSAAVIGVTIGVLRGYRPRE